MANFLFFGRLSEASDGFSSPLPSGVTSIDAVKIWLSKDNPMLAEAFSGPGILVSVNQEMVHGDQSVSDADEIAFMSPLSGG